MYVRLTAERYRLIDFFTWNILQDEKERKARKVGRVGKEEAKGEKEV